MAPKRKRALKNNGGRNKKIKTEPGTDAIVVKNELQSDASEKKHVNNKDGLLKEISFKKAFISCTECSKRFRFKNSFTEHQRVEHSKVPGSVACDQCHVRCPDKATLRKHVNNFHNRDIYECEHCKKKFVRHAHVLRHLAQKGCGGQQTFMYPCEICNAQFSRKDNLMVHLRLQHIMRKDFVCKQCQYSTGTFTKLIIHVQKYHTDKPQQYECDHCGKVTSSRAAMCKHLEIHGEKKFACDVCGYSTFTIEVMRRHVLTHVQDKPYKCSECDHSFIQRVQLLKHQEKHRSYSCNECEKSFAKKSDLLIHSRQHTPDKKSLFCPIENCEDSKKNFEKLANLREHVREHTEIRPFECEVCNKRFRNEVDMRRHMQLHTLERPRRCMYCVAPRAYVRGEQLVKHVRKAHTAVFRDHLAHVRRVLGETVSVERVKKSELDSILNMLDAEADRILQGYGEGVLYGGMQEVPPDDNNDDAHDDAADAFRGENPLMSEEELEMNLNKLLVQLIDKELLECFGWPDESVDTVLEKVIEHCGAKPADRSKWTRVQRLRENSKHLFLYVIEDKNIARMLDSHTIDQIVKHILEQVSEEDTDKKVSANKSE